MQNRLYSHLQWTKDKGQRVTLDYNAHEKEDAFPYPHFDAFITPHDEVIYFLHIASEVEHALMLQYLYAAYSLGGDQVPEQHSAKVASWQERIVKIAREEMGHLVTVQNILHLLGGPLTLEREDFPNPTDLYPFDFTLEPLTKESLGKYVLAEMPDDEVLKTHDLALYKEVERIKKKIGLKGFKVNRVGRLYEMVIKLLDKVDAADFRADSLEFQANSKSWGLGIGEMIIGTASSQQEAKTALGEVAEQGEGKSIDFSDDSSHFMRFLKIYREFPEHPDWEPTKKVPTNPCTNDSRWGMNDNSDRMIKHPMSRLWAQLSNHRYRMLLQNLNHALHTQSNTGDTQALGLLVSLTFREMYNLRSIAGILTNMPQLERNNEGRMAGPPFEMPYSNTLPNREVDRWRGHRDQILTSNLIIEAIINQGTGKEVNHLSYLQALKVSDAKALESIQQMIPTVNP